MTYSQFRMMGGEENDKSLSEFVALSQKKDAVSAAGVGGFVVIADGEEHLFQ
jgi:hypothetical protein